jgi:hypothetical protein
MSTKSNIVIDQGADFLLEVTAFDVDDNPLDLETYTVEAQMRKHFESVNAITFTAVVSDDNKIILSLTATQTQDIVPGRYYYDVLITSNTNVITRLLEGIATVTPGITRE